MYDVRIHKGTVILLSSFNVNERTGFGILSFIPTNKLD